MSVDIVIGLSVGDEGKGKVTDYLIKQNKYDIVARYNGGPNAGHTIYDNYNNKCVLHSLPVGIIHKNVTSVIGNGCVVNTTSLIKEMLMVKDINPNFRLLISENAHVITQLDIDEESFSGENEKIGTTKRGITPCYRHKYNRTGIRIYDLLFGCKHIHELLKRQLDFISHIYSGKLLDEINKSLPITATMLYNDGLVLKPYIADITEFMYKSQSTRNILCEGAQGSMLDIDFGIYPYVSSSTSSACGALTGLGLSPKYINRIYGVTKGYVTKVGTGPFPTKMDLDCDEAIRKYGEEYGATTGRPRKVGWLDLPQLKYACSLNDITDLIITKLDIMSVLPYAKICTYYFSNNETPKVYLTHKSNLDYDNLIPNYKSFPIWSSIENIKNNKKFNSNLKSYVEFILKHIDSYKSNNRKINVIISTGPKSNQMIKWR